MDQIEGKRRNQEQSQQPGGSQIIFGLERGKDDRQIGKEEKGMKEQVDSWSDNVQGREALMLFFQAHIHSVTSYSEGQASSQKLHLGQPKDVLWLQKSGESQKSISVHHSPDPFSILIDRSRLTFSSIGADTCDKKYFRGNWDLFCRKAVTKPYYIRLIWEGFQKSRFPSSVHRKILIQRAWEEA